MTNARKPAITLGVKILLIAAVALVAAYFCYYFIYDILTERFFESVQYTAYWEEKCAATVEEFKDHIHINQMTTKAAKEDIRWIHEHRNMVLEIEMDGEYAYPEGFGPEDSGLIPIKCTDGTIYVGACPSYPYYRGRNQVIGIILGFSCFLLIISPYIIRIIVRIGRLYGDVEILASGNLNHVIDAKGKDEIAQLRLEINKMRMSLIDKIESEQQAQKANYQLITSLSHDLRTPLTKLQGYLEILQFGKGGPPEEQAVYLEKALGKAYQLGSISDELFSQFAYENSGTGHMAEFEMVKSTELFNQILSEQSYELQAVGFRVNTSYIVGNTYVNVVTIEVCRLFENIFSNIMKYADVSEPIKISTKETGKTIFIKIENAIKHPCPPCDSHGIGLTSMYMLAKHNRGNVTISKTAFRYTVEVEFISEEKL